MKRDRDDAGIRVASRDGCRVRLVDTDGGASPRYRDVDVGEEVC